MKIKSSLGKDPRANLSGVVPYIFANHGTGLPSLADCEHTAQKLEIIKNM